MKLEINFYQNRGIKVASKLVLRVIETNFCKNSQLSIKAEIMNGTTGDLFIFAGNTFFAAVPYPWLGIGR